MKVYGASILKGLMYTLKTFVGTYVEDFKGGSKSFEEHGLRSATEGAVTGFAISGAGLILTAGFTLRGARAGPVFEGR